MSGSRTWREYVTDGGNLFSIAVDKSNANTINALNAQRLCTVRSFNHPQLPVGVTPRRIHCFKQGFPRIKRSFIVGNTQAYSSLDMLRGEVFLQSLTNDDGSGSAFNWIVTGYTGESATVAQYIGQSDTGLTDGSIT